MSETLELQNQSSEQKSFDVLSTIRLYQYDLQTFGRINPETRQRVYDEELTYIAEGINLPLYTEFVLHQEDDELVYFHEGRWRSYIGSLVNNLDIARQEAERDPRRSFLAERAAEDLRVGYQIANLQPGEAITFKAEFPQLECDLYGSEFIGELGFQPQRKMGFLYEAEKTIDGRTILRSQTVDGNEAEAYAAAMESGARGGSIEDMRDAYDEIMQKKYGSGFYAGRRLGSEVPEQNAWSHIQNNRDLVEYLMEGIEKIARQNLSEPQTETAKKHLTYGVWARLKERLDNQAVRIETYEYRYTTDSIRAEVESAYEAAAARGETLMGCGGLIAPDKTFTTASSKDVFNSIFGNEKKWFGCPYCGAKQYGDPCAARLYCLSCNAEVKNGKVLSTGRARTIKKGFFDIFIDEIEEWNRRYDLEQAEKKARLAAAENT